MAISLTTINKNYNQVLRKNKGAQFVKVDLHVHTPASGDAAAKKKYNFKFNIKNIPTSLKSSKILADNIVNSVKAKGLKLIAITDHNTPSNTHPEDLTNTWYQLINEAAKKEGICVLPGVEISTDDLHILVILDPKENEPVAHTIHRINFLLQDCKFDLGDYGNYRATGSSSLFDVLEYIENLGTSAIAIPAHIDGGKKAMLALYKHPGNIYSKLINHPNLNVVEVTKITTPTRKKIGSGKKAESVGNYFNRIRDENRSPIAFIRNSDGHSLTEIGKRLTYIRMGTPSYWSLKNALEDPETRVKMEHEYKPTINRTRIIGLAIKKGKKWSYVTFNENLNCIIGKKETHRTTIMELIIFGLNRFHCKEEEQDLIDQKYSVNVFIGNGSDVFCYHKDRAIAPEIFKLKNNKFSKYNTKPNLDLPRKYDHEKLAKIFSRKAELIDFLDKHVFKDAKLSSDIENRDKLIDSAKTKGFINCTKAEIDKIMKVCDAIYKRRNAIKKKSLKKYENNMIKVNIKKGRGSPKPKNLREDYFKDKAEIEVLINSKYKNLKRMSLGDRNANIMKMLMNQEGFGPMIIKDPEQHLDVSSLTEILIPRIRELKTRQQIICSTQDEHILLSGDAEQVIATQSEKDIEIEAGDINNKDIQEQIMEIFEGRDIRLKEKIRKLERVLEKK